MLSNIYAKNIDVNALGSKQRKKTNALLGKNNKQNKIETDQQIVDEAALQESDRELLEVMKGFLQDILENTYNPLITELHSQLTSRENLRAGDELFDRLHYFRICAFMIQVQRLKAYEAHSEKKREAKDKMDIDNDKNNNNLFGNSSKSKVRAMGQSRQASKLPEVPFEINIAPIGASLMLQNFEYLYATLIMKVKIKMKSNESGGVTDKEFHAGLALLTQFLFIVRDMASSSDERNQKNAKILQQNIFYNDLVSIAQFAFSLFDRRKHNMMFLQDIVEFTHLMLEMLDQYSKGKVLTIQTHKKRRVKKKKNKKLTRDDDELALQDHEIDSEDEELGYFDEEEEENVERQFDFRQELCVLVDYRVIEKYLEVLRTPELFNKKPNLLQACAHFFRRIVQ